MMRYFTIFLLALIGTANFAATALAGEISVAITSPARKTHFANCPDIDITIETSVTEGTIAKVEIFQNGKLLRSDTRAPYDYTWKNVPNGNYFLTARAADNAGNKAVSEAVFIVVGNTDDGNLIMNGEFNCSLSPWRLDYYEGALATIKLVPDAFLTEDTSAAYIEIQEIGNFSWGVQLMQKFILEQGHTYEVSFVAEAEEPKPIQITFSQDYDPWAPHWNQDVTIGKLDEFGPFIYECGLTDSLVMFKFVVGGNKIPMYLDAVKVIDRQWSAVSPEPAQITGNFQLFQNYPNPFNPTTTIRYSLEKTSRITLSIYNLLGETVRIFSQNQPAGLHAIQWDGRDALGNPVNAGMYLYKLETAAFSMSRKMVLLK